MILPVHHMGCSEHQLGLADWLRSWQTFVRVWARQVLGCIEIVSRHASLTGLASAEQPTWASCMLQCALRMQYTLAGEGSNDNELHRLDSCVTQPGGTALPTKPVKQVQIYFGAGQGSFLCSNRLTWA